MDIKQLGFKDDLILKDIERINNSGNRKSRETTLRDYYKSPSICKCCGNMIMVDLGQKISEVRRKVFCNKTCAAKFNNTNSGSRKHGKTSLVWKCDDEVFIEKYKNSETYRQLAFKLGYSTSSARVTESLRKRIEMLGLEQYQEQSYIGNQTKECLISRCKSWGSWRSQIQKHARRVYRESQKEKKCCICGYDLTYEVAHVKPVSEFSGETLISEINAIENLVALCPNHHWEYDHGYISIWV